MTTINQQELVGIEIPLPPTIEEQRRIASILDEQMKAVEEARRAVEEQLAAANHLPNALLREVFESEEAQKWQKKKLGEVCLRISNGTTTTQNQESRGFPVSRIETISLGNINSKRVGYIDCPIEELKKYVLNKGDILFSHINSIEKLGNCALYIDKPEILIHGMNLLRFEIDNDLINSDFLLALLRTDKSKKFFEANARRAIGQASLNTKDLNAMEIAIAPIEEQRNIAERSNEQMQAVEALKQSLTEKLAAVNKLPAALLRKAFAGEI